MDLVKWNGIPIVSRVSLRLGFFLAAGFEEFIPIMKRECAATCLSNS
jgi:hypothetical protein